MKKPASISIIVPFYNEEAVIGKVLTDLKLYMDTQNQEYEIIAINDGSTDNGGSIASAIDTIRVINHFQNRGYGAAIKSGVKSSTYDWIVWYDGDGQHRPDHISKVSEIQGDEQMVVGARSKDKNPSIRKPGKKLLYIIANYLVDTKIPDLNSGLRMVHKDAFQKFEHLYPDGFSISTTITLSLLKGKIPVRYTPIEIEARTGSTSTVKAQDAFRMLSLIFRIITLFSPMRVFLPLAVFSGVLTGISLVHNVVIANLTDTTVVLFVCTLIMFSFGITLDHVAAIRRDMHNL